MKYSRQTIRYWGTKDGGRQLRFSVDEPNQDDSAGRGGNFRHTLHETRPDFPSGYGGNLLHETEV